MTKLYPVKFADICREHGLSGARCMWQMRGPKDTQVSWIECYIPIGPMGQMGEPVLVETFKDGGWQAFVASGSIKIDETMAWITAQSFHVQQAA